MKANGNLLDTNFAINFIKGLVSANVLNPFKNCKVFFITVGELMFGAEKSKFSKINRSRYLNFCTDVGIENLDLDTSIEYGKIKNELKSKGTPIPDNDAWLAAAARAHNMTFITYDKHFKRVRNLKLKLLKID